MQEKDMYVLRRNGLYLNRRYEWCAYSDCTVYGDRTVVSTWAFESEDDANACIDHEILKALVFNKPFNFRDIEILLIPAAVAPHEVFIHNRDSYRKQHDTLYYTLKKCCCYHTIFSSIYKHNDHCVGSSECGPDIIFELKMDIDFAVKSLDHPGEYFEIRIDISDGEPPYDEVLNLVWKGLHNEPVASKSKTECVESDSVLKTAINAAYLRNSDSGFIIEVNGNSYLRVVNNETFTLVDKNECADVTMFYYFQEAGFILYEYANGVGKSIENIAIRKVDNVNALPQYTYKWFDMYKYSDDVDGVDFVTMRCG